MISSYAYGMINRNGVNLYEEASSNSPILLSFSMGDTVEADLADRHNSMICVTTTFGVEGYISESAIDIIED